MKYKISKNFFIISILGVFLFLSFVPFVNASSDIPPSVSGYANKYNSESECENYGPGEGVGNCYGFFASQKNDIDYCNEAWEKAFEKETAQLKDDSFKDWTVSTCITRFSIDKNNVSYCDALEKEDLRQECMAKYYMFKNEISGCGKITDKFWKDKCSKELNKPRIRQASGYLAYISLLSLVVLTIIFVKLKFSTLKILNILTFTLLPVILLLGFGCNFPQLSEFNGIEIYLYLLGDFGKVINLYHIILLFYGIFCCVVAILNIRCSLKELKNNDPHFKKNILLSILIFFIAIIMLTSGSGDYSDEIWVICNLLFFISVEIFSVKYSIKLKSLKNNQYYFFIDLAVIMGFIFIILAVVTLFLLSMMAAIG